MGSKAEKKYAAVKGNTQLIAARCGPGSRSIQAMCLWGSTNLILLSLLLNLQLLCLVCKHRGGMFVLDRAVSAVPFYSHI